MIKERVMAPPYHAGGAFEMTQSAMIFEHTHATAGAGSRYAAPRGQYAAPVEIASRGRNRSLQPERGAL
jgi:hypothetical protein